jgi:hypothetical protein
LRYEDEIVKLDNNNNNNVKTLKEEHTTVNQGKQVIKNKDQLVITNNNFALINNNDFNTMSFRQNNSFNNCVEESLSKLHFEEINPLYENQTHMRESLNLNNKFSEKFLSDDEVYIKSDVELSNQGKKKSVRVSSEHKRKIKIKIIDEREYSVKREEAVEDSANCMQVSNEIKKGDIKVNKFDSKPFINANEKVFEQYENGNIRTNEYSEIIFKKTTVKGSFFKEAPERSGVGAEVVNDCIKASRVEKEFDYDNLSKIKPVNDKKKEVLIRKIAGEERMYSNVNRLMRKNGNGDKPKGIRVEKVIIYDSRNDISGNSLDKSSSLNKSHHLDLSKEKLFLKNESNIDIVNGLNQESNTDNNIQETFANLNPDNVKTVITSLNTNFINSSSSEEDIPHETTNHCNLDARYETKGLHSLKGNSDQDAKGYQTIENPEKLNLEKAILEPAKDNINNPINSIVYQIKTSIMDDRMSCMQPLKVESLDLTDYKVNSQNLSFIELIVKNCYSKVKFNFILGHVEVFG